jgi:CheY-like chemotaxis protein
MNNKVLIVEDEFIVADDLRLTLEGAGYIVCGIASSVEKGRLLLKQHRPGMALLDIHLKGKLTGIDFAKELKEEGIPFIYLSAYSNQTILEAAKATQPYGFLVKPFRDKDVLVALDIARYRHENNLESSMRREHSLMHTADEIHLGSGKPFEKLLKLVIALQPHIPFDYLAIGKRVPGEIPYNWVGFLRVGRSEYQSIGLQELLNIAGMNIETFTKIRQTTIADKKSGWYNAEAFLQVRQSNAFKDLLARTFHLESNLTMSFTDMQGDECYFSIYSRKSETYHEEHLKLLGRLYNLLVTGAAYISKAENTRPFESTRISPFTDIVGNDTGLLSVLDQASQVAPFDTSVLIQGETGTGKEKVASCIHELSSRF